MLNRSVFAYVIAVGVLLATVRRFGCVFDMVPFVVLSVAYVILFAGGGSARLFIALNLGLVDRRIIVYRVYFLYWFHRGRLSSGRFNLFHCTVLWFHFWIFLR